MNKKKTPSSSDSKSRLRALTSDDLKAVCGGGGHSRPKPGQYTSSSGGGGTTL